MELTERAQQVIRLAREEAVRLGDQHVGTDHLLLSMLRDADGAGAFLLADLGVDHAAVAARVHSEDAPTG